MKGFITAVLAVLVLPEAGISYQTTAPTKKDVSEKAGAPPFAEQQAAQIAQVAAERAQAIKDYPAWLLKTIATEFAAVLDAGNRFLAAPSQKNWELFQATKKEQLQRAGVHICKFDEASQLIAKEEKERLSEQLAGMIETFAKSENALEAKMDGLLAQQRGREDALAR
jgi:methionyl-tRNA synthetase